MTLGKQKARAPKTPAFYALVGAGLLLASPALADCATELREINAVLEAATVDPALAQNAEAMVQEAQRMLDSGQENQCMAMAAQIKQSIGLS